MVIRRESKRGAQEERRLAKTRSRRQTGRMPRTLDHLPAGKRDELRRSPRTGVTRGNGAPTSYGYDAAGRLTSLAHNPTGTAQDVTFGFGFNPASQIVSRSSSNAIYSYTPATGATTYVNNGRNQVTSAGGAAITYDTRWNITGTGAATYGYNALNQLVTATVGGTTTALAYDPADRLYQLGTTRFLYDGPQAIAEYDTSNVLQRRFVPGPGTDELVAVHEGSGTTDRRWPLQDERGSIIAATSGTGAASGINTYDEYGRPAAGNVGRFQYTGQMWLSQAGVYHYKARAYEPNLGRFLQTDPVGYEDGLNLYAYVQNDPVNATDPDGQACVMFNGWSPYCRRAELYRRYDQALGGHTRFFAAAARTVTFFASGDFPVGGQILGSRGSTRRNFAALSARLERLNNAAARQIESGALRGRGLDAVLVHREQSAVQNFLENLQGSAPDEYAAMVSAANAFINGGNSLWPSDWNYLGVIGSVRSALGRDIDFANQGDREAIGNALVEAVRSSCLRPPEQGGCSARQ